MVVALFARRAPAAAPPQPPARSRSIRPRPRSQQNSRTDENQSNQSSEPAKTVRLKQGRDRLHVESARWLHFGIKNTDALKALTADPKPMLIDLREPKEITQTIESAVNIPLRSLLKNLDKLPAKDQALILYCGSGHRSAIAATLLQMLGYKNAKSIQSGFGAWKTASLPIIDSAPVEPKASGVKVEVDQDLLAALDAWLGTMPDDFWGAPPASAAKAFAADPKPFIIDVRTEQEILAAGSIEGSVNIVLPELVKNLDKLPADKNAAIYTYCAVGHRGSIALTALRLMPGYTNVKSISGGFDNWVKAGLPKVGGFDATKAMP
ncbi:MAG: rhodanese-like domain-containing protein [Anaerolineae bacterium]